MVNLFHFEDDEATFLDVSFVYENQSLKAEGNVVTKNPYLEIQIP
jgi:hypothetical protein